jgi:hypothetical protein
MPDTRPELPLLTGEAIDWLLRLSSGAATVEDADTFKRWHAQSPGVVGLEAIQSPEGKAQPIAFRHIGETDCMADDAVKWQPVSTPNSLLTGKLTGNFRRFRHSGANFASNQRGSSAGYS